MTYVDDRRRHIVPTKQIQPANQRRSPLGPRNSLDYWQKGEDHQSGVTYFWSNQQQQQSANGRGAVRSGAAVSGIENVLGTPTLQQRRPAPFPLTLPPTVQQSYSNNSNAAIYQSRPMTMPRARLVSKTENLHNGSTSSAASSSSNASALNNNNHKGALARYDANVRDSPIFSAPRETQNDIIWSIPRTAAVANAPVASSPYDSVYRSHPLIVGPEYGSQPLCSGTNLLNIPIGSAPPAKRDKPRNGRQKPRWGRFMQTLCCCVSPQQENEKPTSPRPNSSNLIQVLKNGNNMAPLVDSKQNDYSQAAQTITTVSNGTIISPKATNKTFNHFLLPPVRPADSNKKCLIIDLDETLVHSSFKPVKNADFVIPVEIDGVEHKVYVLKRPYVDEFLARVGEKYECVLFTASLAKYADPVADLLDKRGVFRSRLFREACVFNKGNYVKDLARLGRDIEKVMIIDNSPASYAFHPSNAIPVQTWFDDPTDVELLDLLPVLDRLEKAESVYDILGQSQIKSVRDILLERSN